MKAKIDELFRWYCKAYFLGPVPPELLYEKMYEIFIGEAA